MKAPEYKDRNKANCDRVLEQVGELKTLLSYHSEEMIVLNQTRVLSEIDTAMDSLRELRAYVEDVVDAGERTIDVVYMAEQGSIELFRSLADPLRVYARMPFTPEFVQWASTSKGFGGYEPDCLLRPGITIRVADLKDHGTFIVEEKMKCDESGCGPMARKAFPFKDEFIKTYNMPLL